VQISDTRNNGTKVINNRKKHEEGSHDKSNDMPEKIVRLMTSVRDSEKLNLYMI
jgi:hypothetical protein